LRRGNFPFDLNIEAKLLTEYRSPGDIGDVFDALQATPIAQCSRLAAPPIVVWERVATKEGINAELAPFLAMTFPAEWKKLDVKDVTAGPPPLRSVLLLFGIVPVDLHRFAFLSVTPDHGFLERSCSLLHYEWIHERRLEAVRDGTEIVDRVHYRCRLPGLGFVLRPVIRFIFCHRHRRLLQHFGAMKPS